MEEMVGAGVRVGRLGDWLKETLVIFIWNNKDKFGIFQSLP